MGLSFELDRIHNQQYLNRSNDSIPSTALFGVKEERFNDDIEMSLNFYF